MDEIFSKCPYLVVRILSGATVCGEILRRNVQQISRNSFMRNLLTALGAPTQSHGAQEVFLSQMANFFNSSQINFPRSQVHNALPAHEFYTDGTEPRAYERHRALGAEQAFLHKSQTIFNLRKKCVFSLHLRPSESPQFCCFLSLSTAAKLFASQYLWLATPWL